MSNVSDVNKSVNINRQSLNQISNDYNNNSVQANVKSLSSATEEILEFDSHDRIFEIGNFVDDILNAIGLCFGLNLTKNIGVECFKNSNLTNVPDVSKIEKVYLSGPNGEYINVQLKSGEKYMFDMTNNSINLHYYWDANGLNSLGRVVDFNYNDIVRIIDSHSGFISIETSDGFVYNYRLENGQYVISSININNNYLQFHSDVTEEDYEYVKNLLGNYWIDGTTINGYTTHTVSTPNGSRIYKVYWIGSTTTYNQFINGSLNVFKSIDNYPQNILNFINSSEFEGFIYGSKDDIQPTITGYAAFAYGYKYVFFNQDTSTEVVFHEMGHIIDNLFGNGWHNSSMDEVFNNLFEKYNKSIQQLNNIRYLDPDGVPNESEFFAELSNEYFTEPEELQILLPECYNYIRDFYNNL